MKNDDYNYDNLKKMTYIDYVEKEVTRFYGPVSGIFTRNVVKDHFIKGVPMKKNTNVSPQFMGVHYSEKYYKNPSEFRPERWISECNQIPAFALGGFNAGPRVCFGKYFAKLESKIGFIKFMKRYEKIELPVKEFEMFFKAVYQPKDFKAKMTKKV